MTDKNLLHIFAFGVLEYVLLLVFSYFIGLYALMLGVTYASIVSLVMLGSGIVVAAWFYFFRQKAKAYLTATVFRWVSIILVLMISDWKATTGDYLDLNDLYWYGGALIIAIIVMVISFKRDCNRWSHTLEVWKQIGKIDLERKLFRISVPNGCMNKNGNEQLKKALIFGIPMFFVLKLLLNFFGNEAIKDVIVKLLPIFLALMLSMLLGIFISWLVNFTKMEKEMRIEFITEYGDKEELTRLESIKWKK